MKLTKRAAQTVATLALTATAAVGVGTLAATPASAQVSPGNYTLIQNGVRTPGVWHVGSGTLRNNLPSQFAASSASNPLQAYRVTQTRNGGFADNGLGGRIVLRPNGHGGYVGERYLAGIRTSSVRLTPR